MRVVYTGAHAGVVTPEGVEFVHGEPVEVDTELGESLTARTDFEAEKDGN